MNTEEESPCPEGFTFQEMTITLAEFDFEEMPVRSVPDQVGSTFTFKKEDTTVRVTIANGKRTAYLSRPNLQTPPTPVDTDQQLRELLTNPQGAVERFDKELADRQSYVRQRVDSTSEALAA